MPKLSSPLLTWVGVLSLVAAGCGGSSDSGSDSSAVETPASVSAVDGATDDTTAAPESEATVPAQSVPGSALGGAGDNGQVVADLGFRPDVNGFSFPNYGSDQAVTNLTPVEVRRMFGDGVCATIQGDTCLLTPPASQWMEQTNAGMSGGHCEGFAALSLLFYSGLVDPQAFGAATAGQLVLDGNEPLQREIAYWFTTQGTQPAQNAILHGTPAQIVETLKLAYAAPNASQETYAVGIYKADGTGGHAVTAYGVEDQGNGIAWILIYDNNYPGEARHIDVDTNADTWQYEAAINPQVEPDLYQGDANTNTLEIVPTGARLGVQACPFCPDTTPSGFAGTKGTAATSTLYNQVFMEGDAAFLVKDDQGRRLGFEGGKFFNEIPEANYRNIKGETLAQQDVPPFYEFPVGQEINLTIDGSSIPSKEDNTTDAVVIGPGYYIGVEGIYMDPGQIDTLTVGGDGRSVAYRTDYEESPDIIVGIERPQADFELALRGTSIKAGSSTNVSFDPDSGILSLSSTSDEDGSFYVSISRIDDNGEETFESGDEDVVLQPGDIVYFSFGEWNGQGSSLKILFDDGGDGTIDQTLDMADQQ